MKKHIESAISFFILIALFSCTNNRNATYSYEESKIERNKIEIVVDSLLQAYPKTFENPIQKSDFLKALEESVQNISPVDLEQFMESVPFKLLHVQNVPNQPDDKYLTAFEFEKQYFMEGESENGYSTIGDDYKIQIYCFGALDKNTASLLDSHSTYKLSGKPSIIKEPSIGGWDNTTIQFGIEIEDIKVIKFEKEQIN